MNKGDKSRLGTDDDGTTIQAASLHNAATQTLAISGTTAESASAVTSSLVRLLATTACFVRSGVTGGSAVVTDLPLAANVPEYFTLKKGHFVQAITSGGSGTLYITGC